MILFIIIIIIIIIKSCGKYLATWQRQMRVEGLIDKMKSKMATENTS